MIARDGGTERHRQAIGILDLSATEQVGFVRDDGFLSVAFPKVYAEHLHLLHKNRELLVTHAALLARVLRRYRDDLARAFPVDNSRSGTHAADISEQGGLLDLLDAAAELRADYIQSGLFAVKNPRDASDASSPIAWPRTIRDSQVVISDSDIVYVNAFHRSRRRDPFDFFHLLHARVVSESLRLLGESSVPADDASLDDEMFAAVRATPEAFLAPIRDRMFRDRGRRLVELIAQFLDAQNRTHSADARGESSLCLTTEFELVWEHMLRVLFANDEGRRQAMLASGRWSDNRTGAKARGIRPRVDILRVGRSRAHELRYFCLLDAKDKPVRPPNDRSGSESDHYKQIVYAQLLQVPISSLFVNGLVFPFLSLPQKDHEFVRVLGYHWWTEIAASLVIELGLEYSQVCEGFLYERAVDVEQTVQVLLAGVGVMSWQLA